MERGWYFRPPIVYSFSPSNFRLWVGRLGRYWRRGPETSTLPLMMSPLLVWALARSLPMLSKPNRLLHRKLSVRSSLLRRLNKIREVQLSGLRYDTILVYISVYKILQIKIHNEIKRNPLKHNLLLVVSAVNRERPSLQSWLARPLRTTQLSLPWGRLKPRGRSLTRLRPQPTRSSWIPTTCCSTSSSWTCPRRNDVTICCSCTECGYRCTRREETRFECSLASWALSDRVVVS